MGWKVSKKRKEEQRKKTVSLLDVIFAIRENGLPQARSKFWRNTNSRDTYIDDEEFQEAEIESACAIGMAALNLGVDWMQLERELMNISIGDGNSVRDDIIGWNDSHMDTLQEIFDKLKSKYPDKFDVKFNLIEDINVIKA